MQKNTIFNKYSNFAKYFIFNFAIKLLEYSSINNHFINLVDNK